MNENFNNGLNGNSNVQNNGNNENYTNWQNTNGYKAPNNPYVQPVSVPPVQKEKTKKGTIIAVAIVCLSLILASIILGYSILNKGTTNETTTVATKANQENATVPGDGHLSFAETPNGTSSTEGGMSAKDVYKKIHESSVGITVYASGSDSIVSEGTGIVMGVNEDNTGTYIITCAHVINKTNAKIVVQTADDSQYEATIVGKDLKTDIGVLQVESTELKAAEFADSTSLEVGDTVYAIGNPGGSHFFGSFTNGMVSAIGRPIDSPVGYEVACIQHTAPINPGNSGGALVNAYGQVVGVNSSKISAEDFEGMGFSVPSTMVKQIVDELIKHGYVTNRPILGIEFSVASTSQSYYMVVRANDLPAGTVVIESISKESDMVNTKAKAGDMIIAVNGDDLDTYDVLLDAVQKGKIGDTLTLTIARRNPNNSITTFDIKVKLVEDKA